MNPNNDLRGAYHQFLLSEAGKDFITRIVAYETQLMTENYQTDTTADKKVTNTDKASGLYWVRTLLGDLSKPTPAPRAGRTPRSGNKS